MAKIASWEWNIKLIYIKLVIILAVHLNDVN